VKFCVLHYAGRRISAIVDIQPRSEKRARRGKDHLLSPLPLRPNLIMGHVKFIEFLLVDLICSRRTLVAGPVEIDDVSIARVFVSRMIR
jgi:hypothetical protein